LRRLVEPGQYVSIRYTERLLEPIGNIPPVEAEARYYAQLEEQAVAA